MIQAQENERENLGEGESMRKNLREGECLKE